MIKLKQLLFESTWEIPPKLNTDIYISEDLKYHIENGIPLGMQIHRYGSKKYFDLLNEVSILYNNKMISLNENDIDIIKHYSNEEYNGLKLNHIYEDIDLFEAQYQGKDVDLNKPKRGGSKKFYVYVKNPKTGKIKKVSFGAKSGGGNLSVKLTDPKAKSAFAKRHDCEHKNDPLTPGYWSCRLSRYTRLLGLKGSGKWW